MAKFWGGICSGRCHSQAITQAITTTVASTAQWSPSSTMRETLLALIQIVAIHFARRLTTPPRRQAAMGGPSREWFSNQLDSLGEL